jgi:hypothetical protein
MLARECPCGSHLPIIAVAPGDEPDRCDLFALSRGVAMRVWCSTCWPVLAARKAETQECVP